MSPEGEIISNYIFGAISGACATTVSHPFFRMKTELQNGKKLCNNNLMNFKWMYSGVSRAMIGYGIEKMLVFGTYNTLRTYDINSTIAGMLSGIVAAFSVTPFEQLTIDKQSGINRFTIGHLYSGLIPTIIRESVGFAVHFTAYEYLSSLFNRERNRTKTILCGTGAIICGWSVIAPFDRIKTQIQCGNFNINSYNIKSSYAGFQFALMRAIPFHTTCFLVMEELKKQFAMNNGDLEDSFNDCI